MEEEEEDKRDWGNGFIYTNLCRAARFFVTFLPLVTFFLVFSDPVSLRLPCCVSSCVLLPRERRTFGLERLFSGSSQRVENLSGEEGKSRGRWANGQMVIVLSLICSYSGAPLPVSLAGLHEGVLFFFGLLFFPLCFNALSPNFFFCPRFLFFFLALVCGKLF